MTGSRYFCDQCRDIVAIRGEDRLGAWHLGPDGDDHACRPIADPEPTLTAQRAQDACALLRELASRGLRDATSEMVEATEDIFGAIDRLEAAKELVDQWVAYATDAARLTTIVRAL